MTAQTVKEFGPVTALNATSKDALAKLVKAWESKNAQRVARGAGLGLMAVSLAACGGSDEVAPPPPPPPVPPRAADDLSVSSNDVAADPSIEVGHVIDGVVSEAKDTLSIRPDVLAEINEISGFAAVRLLHDGVATLLGNGLNLSDITTLSIEDANGVAVTVDASEFIRIANILIDDATSSVTLNDLQSPTTVIKLSDITKSGTVTLNYDADKVVGATNVTVSVDEVLHSITVDGGAIETLNLQIADASSDATSTIPTLNVQGITTLNISGGTAGYAFEITNPLNAGITTLNASTVASNLTLDVSGSSTNLLARLGTGNDHLNAGDTWDDNDTIEGGAGSDTVSMRFVLTTPNTLREGTMSGVETLNAVFDSAVTFDATKVTGLETINLGETFNGIDVASAADADFNDMKATTKTLNVEASQIDVEFDYAETGDLTINLNTADEALSIGDRLADDIQLLDVATLAINVNGGNSATIHAMTDLHGDTTSLIITTDSVDGDLYMGNSSDVTAIDGGDALVTVSIAAVNGDMDLYATEGELEKEEKQLYSGQEEHSHTSFIDEASKLQTYTVTTDDADVRLGSIGDENVAGELERLSFDTTQDGSIDQNFIYTASVVGASVQGANIEDLIISTNDKNTVKSEGLTEDDWADTSEDNVEGVLANVVLRGLDALQIDNITLNALDRGNIVLDNQAYTVKSMVFTGSGDIHIHGFDTSTSAFEAVAVKDYVQLAAADASAHTGSRYFYDGLGSDTFYGSTKDDEVRIDTEDTAGGASGAASDSVDTYNDAGGDDSIWVADGSNYVAANIINLDHDSDNTVYVGEIGTTGATGDNVDGAATINIDSTGTQTIVIADDTGLTGGETGDEGLVLINANGDRILGGGDTHAEFVITGFDGFGGATGSTGATGEGEYLLEDVINFNGLGKLSLGATEQVVHAWDGVSRDALNDDSVVLITGEAGTVAPNVGGETATSGSQTINDYDGTNDFTDVAAYLNEAVDVQTVSGGASHVFIVQLSGTVEGIAGPTGTDGEGLDTADGVFAVYYFEDGSDGTTADGLVGASELDYLGTITGQFGAHDIGVGSDIIGVNTALNGNYDYQS